MCLIGGIVYTGKNPKAILSQTLLADGLIDMMETTAFKDINIKNLCINSEVSRQTFYAVFDSKEDILSYIILKRLQDFNKILIEKQATSISLISDVFLTWSHMNVKFLTLLHRNNLMYLLNRLIQRNINELREILSKDREFTVQYDEENFVKVFISSALVGVVSEALEKEGRIDVEKLSKLVTRIFTGAYFKEVF